MKKQSKILFDQTFQYLQSQSNLEKEEIISIVFLLFENLFGLKKTAILANQTIEISVIENQNFEQAVQRIIQNEPIQYILGKTEFYGRTFEVNPNVLIPRPETEELIFEILSSPTFTTNQAFSILDIGTGSGCIAITLAKERANAEVFAMDISIDAIQTAQNNAKFNDALVEFIQSDILNPRFEDLPFQSKSLDLIVSNPPYVTLEEKKQMQANVLDFEPHLALFVTDESPLIFYEKIIHFSKIYLKQSAWLYFEINEQFGEASQVLMQKNGFVEVQILKDMQGKDRMAKGKLGVITNE